MPLDFIPAAANVFLLLVGAILVILLIAAALTLRPVAVTAKLKDRFDRRRAKREVYSLTADIRCLRSGSECPCCTGQSHAFCRYLALDGTTCAVVLDDWLRSVVDLESNEGRKVRVTVELLPEQPSVSFYRAKCLDSVPSRKETTS